MRNPLRLLLCQLANVLLDLCAEDNRFLRTDASIRTAHGTGRHEF